MKHYLTLSAVLIVALFFTTPANAQPKTGWAELDAFRTVIVAVFHPAEDGNLEPAKKRCGELTTKAEAWLASKAPAAFDKPKVKEDLKKLAKDTKALETLFKDKADEAHIEHALIELHDLFLDIEELGGIADKEEKNVHTEAWAEEEAFHTVLAAVFHPSEKGDFEPVKKRVGELVAKAEAWQVSKSPAVFDKAIIKTELKTLVTEAKVVQTLLKDKADESHIEQALIELHDRFHDIEELCGRTHNEHEKH